MGNRPVCGYYQQKPPRPRRGKAHMKTPLIVPPDQARVYNMPLGEARILVDAERSGGSWWAGVFTEEAGFSTPLHLHRETDECFFILEGTLSVYLGGQWRELEAGSLAVIPRGTPHVQANSGPRAVHFLGFGHPCGFDRFFPMQHELLSRIRPMTAEYAGEIAHILRECDTEVLGRAPRRCAAGVDGAEVISAAP
jgi:quercetin dioxygenase-like cupin family protein